jgi:hypothetical protein
MPNMSETEHKIFFLTSLLQVSLPQEFNHVRFLIMYLISFITENISAYLCLTVFLRMSCQKLFFGIRLNLLHAIQYLGCDFLHYIILGYIKQADSYILKQLSATVH